MTKPPHTGVIASEAALAAFRAGLTGPRFFEDLDWGAGRLLAQLPVGVGKSVWLAEAARFARTTARPNSLVLITAPRRDILAETRDRLADLEPVLLTGRPRRRCGELDPEWAQLERAGCAALARDTLCRRCPERKDCGWRRRMRLLPGARLVLTAQQQLRVNPNFVEQLRSFTGTPRVLSLIDESDMVCQPFARRIAREDIARLDEVIASIDPDVTDKFDGANEWSERLPLLLRANTDDLRSGDWTLPRPPKDWALAAQRLGRERFGMAFRYAGYDLRLFTKSDPVSRGQEDAGALAFAATPDLGDEFAVFTGSIATGLVRHRLDPDRVGLPLHAPFEGLRFVHPGTTWVNINDRSGAASWFPKNAERVLEFFARLVARNVRCGKRTLLVCRKKFRGLCRKLLAEKLNALGVGPVEVITGRWDSYDLTDPKKLPLITFGVSGINRFEEFDCVCCLTGYYVSPAAVEQLVNDLEAPVNHVAVQLGFTGNPARRTVTVSEPMYLNSVVPELARRALAQREADLVVQAVGRVRPFTRPREVVTFYSGELPGVVYDQEFTSLREAREHFGIETAREERVATRTARARQLRDSGATRDEIAVELCVSRATVGRYLKRASEAP